MIRLDLENAPFEISGLIINAQDYQNKKKVLTKRAYQLWNENFKEFYKICPQDLQKPLINYSWILRDIRELKESVENMFK